MLEGWVATWAVCRRHLAKQWNNRGGLIFILGFPLVFMGLMGLILQGGGWVTLSVLVLDASGGPPSEEMPGFEDFLDFEGSPFKEIHVRAPTPAEEQILLNDTPGEHALKELARTPTGREATVLIYLPPGFYAVSPNENQTAHLSAWVLSGEGEQAKAAEGSLYGVIQAYKGELQRGMAAAPPYGTPKDHFLASPLLYNIETVANDTGASPFERSLGGFILLGLLYGSIPRAASSTASERDSGVRSRLLITAAPRWSLFLGDIFHQIILFGIQAAVIITLAALVFDAEIRGSPLLIALTLILTIISMMGVGYVIARAAKSAQVAQAVATLVAIPVMFLSGAAIPLWSLPPVLQDAAKWNPFANANAIVSRIVAYNDGLAETSDQLIFLATFAASVLALGMFLVAREMGSTTR